MFSTPFRCVQVACLADGEAHLALEKKDQFAVQTKPHGHGDVHGVHPAYPIMLALATVIIRWQQHHHFYEKQPLTMSKRHCFACVVCIRPLR